jgi:hypothetical protein
MANNNKKKLGRPTLEDKKTSLNLVMHPEDLNRLMKWARYYKRTKSELTRHIIKCWLDDSEERQSYIDAVLLKTEDPEVRRYIKRYNCLPEEALKQ